MQKEIDNFLIPLCPGQFPAECPGQFNRHLHSSSEILWDILMETYREKRLYTHDKNIELIMFNTENQSSFRNNPKEFLSSIESSFSCELYRFKIEYNEGYSGLLLEITDSYLSLVYQEKLPFPIVESIINSFNNQPIILTFNYPVNSFYHHANTTFEDFILPLANNLSKNGIKSQMLSFDDFLFLVKNNPLLSLHERIDLIQINNNTYIEQGELEEQKMKLLTRFKNYWNELTENTKLFLAKGQYLYQLSNRIHVFMDEGSPSALEFSKCIETELENKLLIPFKSYFQENFSTYDIEKDIKDKDLANMTKFLTKENQHAPEMGNLHHFLNTFLHSKSRAKWSIAIKSFGAFIENNLSDKHFLLDKTRLLNNLSLITRVYRNGSAHTKVLPFAKLEEFHLLFFGINNDGFFFDLIKSLSPKK